MDIAWIAGVGASAGLGAAVARRFAKGGLLVAVTGRNAARIESIAGEIKQSGGRALALPGDIASAADSARLGAAIAAAGSLKAAVFNAGNATRGTLLELSAEQFESAWRGSSFAGFLFAQQAVALLKASGGGSLLFTGATASIRGRGPFTAFASAKAALRSLAQSAAREYGPQGIHVAHVIIDGGIDGERLRSSVPEHAARAGEDGLLHPDAIAENYWQLHSQQRSAWTHELDLRPYKETF